MCTLAGLAAPDLQIGAVPGPAPEAAPPSRRGVSILLKAVAVKPWR